MYFLDVSWNDISFSWTRLEAFKLNMMEFYWLELKRGQYVGYYFALHLAELKKTFIRYWFRKKINAH